jgi:hypothetical protein
LKDQFDGQFVLAFVLLAALFFFSVDLKKVYFSSKYKIVSSGIVNFTTRNVSKNGTAQAWTRLKKYVISNIKISVSKIV